MRLRFPLLVSLFVAWPSAQASKLVVTAESSPPSAMLEGGRLVGFAIDKLNLVFKRSGVEADYRVLPWLRAYTMAQNEADTCVVSATRTPEREKLFKWVGPTHENDWTFFGLAGQKLDKLEAARALRIGTRNGDVRGEFLRSNGYLVEPVHDPLSNPRKLLAKRLDLWATSLRVGKAITKQHAWTGQIVPLLTFRRTELYLACHPSVPDRLIKQLNSAFEAIKKDGSARAIEKQYEDWQEGAK